MTARARKVPARQRVSPTALAEMMRELREPVIDYRRRALTLPDVPPGVRTAKMAMDDASSGNFNFLNSAPGAAAFGLFFPGYPWLAELAQRSEYRQPVETTAKEMTRKWIKLKSTGEGDKSDRIQGIEEELRRFNIKELFRTASMYDGFYGLGQLFIEIRGQSKELDAPLEIASQTIERDSLLGFTPIEPMWVTPLVWNSNDATRPDFYVPEAWSILGKKVHNTRLLSFMSRPVPQIIRPAYNMGGISLTQLIEPYVTRWLKTVDAVNRLINNFSIIVLQTDMSAVLAGGGTDAYGSLIDRLKFFTQQRNNQGVFLTDKASEQLEQLSVQLSGLSELQAQAQEHMAAPTHLPLVVLTGITPAGLNASSESELQVFYDWIHSQQECLFRPHLETILRIVQLNRWGNIDKEITFEFEQLKELDGRAAAEVRKMAADAGAEYIDRGVILPEEERQRLATDPESGYTNLDPNRKIEAPDLNEEDEDQTEEEEEAA